MTALYDEIESILLSIEKPGRYCGGEFNSINKENPFFRMALSYPDLYEIGMANHGLRILYDVSNAIEGCACERVFSVADDMRDVLVEKKIPLFTLESRTPLSECDLLGFNVSHELIYTNILQILDLGSVPLRRTERSEKDPFVCFGGDAISNPFPMSLFADLFFAGEGEDGLPELIRCMMDCKEKGLSRKETLEKLSYIDGVIISEYLDQYGKTRKVKKRSYRGHPVNPLRPIVPSMRISQDKAVVEVTRGCANLCKFCHAGYYSLPSRNFSYQDSVDAAKQIIQNTGYDDVTFLSLSIGDYREMTELLNAVLPYFNERGVSISLPSLKVDESTLPVIRTISDIRRTSITLALEAADEEMRMNINKKLTIDELERIVTALFNEHWDTVKFYFMLGLPGYKEKDEAQAILDLLTRIDCIGMKRKKINVTVSPFIPKPHTPLENADMASEEYFRDTVRRLKSSVPKRIVIKNHNIGSSLIEGLLARGDSSISAVIEDAYRKGAHLDSWDEHFRYDIWKQAIAAHAVDTAVVYSSKTADLMQWKIIDTGYGHLTDSMRSKCSDRIFNPSLSRDLDTEASAAGVAAFKIKYDCKTRARVVLTKTGAMKYISHLDYMEIVKRGFRILGIPLSYTQGFNTHERLAAGYPLPLGIESEHELFDLDLYDDLDQSLFTGRDSLAFPCGVRVLSVSEIEGRDSLMAAINALAFTVTAKDPSVLAVIRHSLENRIPLVKVSKEGVKKDVLFADAVKSYECSESAISIIVTIGTPNSLRIDQLVAQLAGAEILSAGIRLLKTASFTADGTSLRNIL